MESRLQDALLHEGHAAISRRPALGLLLGGIAGGFFGVGADARKKKRRRKKRKTQPATPAPPAPVALADASCATANPDAAGNGLARIAQTFRARRTGQLTSASVTLLANDAGMDFEIEIWSVDASAAPGAFLARATVADVPATAFPESRRVTASFSNPAVVTGGTQYALVVTKGDNASLAVAAGDPCADGNIFYAGEVVDPFFPASNVDLLFETVVTG